MVTVKIKINFGGKKYNLKAILKDDLSEIIKCAQNDAVNIDDDYGTEKRWSISFVCPDKEEICVIFFKDEDYNKTLDIKHAHIHFQGHTEDVIYEVDAESSCERS